MSATRGLVLADDGCCAKRAANQSGVQAANAGHHAHGAPMAAQENAQASAANHRIKAIHSCNLRRMNARRRSRSLAILVARPETFHLTETVEKALVAIEASSGKIVIHAQRGPPFLLI